LVAFPKKRNAGSYSKATILGEAKRTFSDTKIQLTTEGKRHLGAIIGSYHAEYVSENVENVCKEQLLVLSEIARIEPHVTYACFTTGLKHKLTFLMRI